MLSVISYFALFMLLQFHLKAHALECYCTNIETQNGVSRIRHERQSLIQINQERTQERSKIKIAKQRETTQDLGRGETPIINLILYYKTPPLTEY